MTTDICRRVGIENPIFAFSHCRDVVVAASKAGGIGIYGGALHSPEQAEIDLQWIEAQLDGLPYGIDLLLPSSFVDISEDEMKSQFSKEHLTFLDGIMEKYGVPKLSEDSGEIHGLLGNTKFTPEQNQAIIDLVIKYNPKVFVSALGTPPASLVEQAHAKGMLVGALCGQAKHAVRHKEAGLDFVVAASYEAGGHTGDIGSIVLIPEIVDAVAPMPVLAAGGIGRGRQLAAVMALGAQGGWAGSCWLTTTESDVIPLIKDKLLAADMTDTVRAKCFTGKFARFLKTDWDKEWDQEGAPKPLPAPLQTALIKEYVERITVSAASGKVGPEEGAGALAFSPVGQIVGAMNESISTRDVIRTMMEEMVEATVNLTEALEE